MRKVGFWGMVAFLVVVVGAVVLAGRMGETSHALARIRVSLAPDLASAAQGVRTLFIVALAEDGRPMPLGAMRRVLGGDATAEGAMDFVLTREAMGPMAQEGEWPATFRLKARLDRDGSGGADQPGDLVGEVAGVRRGQADVEVRIDRVVP